MVYYEGSYVVIGGSSSNPNEIYTSCEIWDQKFAWTKFAPLVKGRWNLGAAVQGKHIYVFGGVNNSKVIMNTIERYSGSNWEMIEIRLPLQLDSPVALPYGNEIYVLGSWKGDLTEETKEKGSLCVFNPLNDSINHYQDIHTNGSRKYSSGNAFILGEKLIVFGGVKKDGEIIDLSEITKGWSPLFSYKSVSSSLLNDVASVVY